jgi:hypothetical protein
MVVSKADKSKQTKKVNHESTTKAIPHAGV